MTESLAPIVTKLPNRGEPEQFTEWETNARESAFELWMSNGRPIIAELVRITERELGQRIPYGTLKRWRDREGWEIEADRRLAALTPNMMIRGALDLTGAFVDAARYVRLSMELNEDGTPKMSVFNRDRFAGAMSVCAALGFSPGSKARPTIPAIGADVPKNLRDLSDDELRRLVHGE